jgi:RNA polymerase sigma-70 factor (ECF subfamily)
MAHGEDRRMIPDEEREAGFDPLQSYERYRAQLFNYFRRCGVRREASEDLTQATFLLLLEDPARFRPERGSLRVFLFGIARNLRRAWMRKNRFWGESFDESTHPAAGRAGAGEDIASIRAAIRSLPDEGREAILLREFHGLSYEELARIQGVPIGTIRSRIARARDELRRRLGPTRPRPERQEP